jgi:hypothetical protein
MTKSTADCMNTICQIQAFTPKQSLCSSSEILRRHELLRPTILASAVATATARFAVGHALITARVVAGSIVSVRAGLRE